MESIDELFETLRAARTWDETSLPPPGAKVIPSVINFKLKRYEDGSPKRF